MKEHSPINPWSSILRTLPLTKAESEVVRRFEIEPEGRSFLPVADILRANRLHDEALELLTQGVERHPEFTVARVVLARELFHKGMIEASWRTLEESSSPLRGNAMAQKLRFKLALLLELYTEADGILQSMQGAQLLDAETKRLADMVTGKSPSHARDKLIQELRQKGTEPLVPEDPRQNTVSPSTPAISSLVSAQQREVKGGTTSPTKGGTVSLVSEYLDARSVIQDPAIAAFHVTSLAEIFRPDGSAAPDRKNAGGVELDSTTLADIYANQGHYGKALEMYRRLLRTSPHNDIVKRRVAELARLEKEQRTEDLTIDPSLVDVMETVEVIDRQIKFYNDLLERLSG